MCKKKIWCIIVGLLVMLPISAQYSQNHVSILDMDATTAVFSTEGFGQNRSEAMENARKATLYKIMYEGVEGFNGNAPIVASSDFQRTNIWLNNFFDGKYAAYKAFLGEVELVGDFEQHSSNEYYCHIHVIIKHDMLFRQANLQGVTKQQSNTLQQQQPVPTELQKQELDKKTQTPTKKVFL